MKKIWILLKTEENKHGDIDVTTKASHDYDEALANFKKTSIDILLHEKTALSSRYGISNNLTFAEYVSIGKEKYGDLITLGSTSYLDGRVLSIVKQFTGDDGTVERTKTNLMLYSCNLEKETTVKLIYLNDSNSVDVFLEENNIF